MGLILAYRAPNPGGGPVVWTTLADVSKGDVIKEWAPDASGQVQTENLAAAVGQLSASYRQPLGNLKTQIAIDLCQTSADETTAAATYAANVINLLGSKNHFRLTSGTTVLYYPNGVASKAKASLQGASVDYQLDLQTDMVTLNQPQ